MSLDVGKKVIVPDLRIMIAPSTSPSHRVSLASFIDTLDVVSVKWHNLGAVPQILNETTGELDTHNFTYRRVYTYKYTVTSKCNSSSAKVYVFTSNDKLPVKNNREIFICKDLELSKYVQLNQILGLENNGLWEYIDDDGTIANNVKKSSAKFGGSMIFNAQKAYADAGTKYDIAGKPGYKEFKFQYTTANSEIIELNIVVG
jgi:hypothetical protein